VTERIPSDHETVESHRVRLAAVGRTGRPEVELPAEVDDDLAAEDVVRLFVGGDEYHARVERALDDSLVVRGAYPNARLARTDGAEGASDALAAWRDDRGLEPGDQLLLDAITPGFAYGLRTPGQRVVYPDRQEPAGALGDIASDLDS
jgi:hypothetical protein